MSRYRFSSIILSLCCAFVPFMGCGEPTTVYESVHVIVAPLGFPPVPYPADNVPNLDKIELGRRLFYDVRLSRDGQTRCASCHDQSHGFADTTMVSIGQAGENGSRNSQSIVNVAYYNRWFWDGRAASLEEQIATALQSAAEMHADTSVMLIRIQTDTMYQSLFARSYSDSSSIDVHTVVQALATFCRTLVSGHSRYDRYLFGESTALSASEQRGMRLFNSDQTMCSRCHSGFNFTDNQFHSIALHAHYYDKGLFYQTLREEDIGKFRTPSLRNIANTAPYTNEGIYSRLEDVVAHYNRGGQPFRFKDTSLIKELKLTEEESADLVAFLRSLSDEEFLHRRDFGNPFR